MTDITKEDALRGIRNSLIWGCIIASISGVIALLIWGVDELFPAGRSLMGASLAGQILAIVEMISKWKEEGTIKKKLLFGLMRFTSFVPPLILASVFIYCW